MKSAKSVGETMTKRDVVTSRKLAEFCLAVLGIFTLMIGALVFLNVATYHFPLWLCADRYVAAELEVTRLHPHRGRTNSATAPVVGTTIEGVIHPGGERVVATSGDIAIEQFVDPMESTRRRLPLRSEIEGQRLAVWYWPEHAGMLRSWHPATVVMPETIPRAGSSVVRNMLIGGAFVGVAVWCFRHVFRALRLAAPPAPRD